MLILLTGSPLGTSVGDERVAALVVGHRLALLVVHHPASAVSRPAMTRSMAASKSVKVTASRVAAGRSRRGLVHRVGQVGAAEARA